MNYKTLIIITLLILVLIGYLYNRNTNEYFTTENISTEEEIEIEESEEQEIESQDILVKNGSFRGGKDITNSGGDKLGNSIIIHPNPGKTSYVLRQTSNISESLHKYKTRYQITINTENSRFYAVTCFVKNSNEYDGNNDIFYIKLYNNTLAPKTLISSGKVLFEKKFYDSIWYKKQYVFQTTSDSNGQIEFLLGYNPENTKGYRYITDISVYRHYPLLKKFPVNYNLVVLLNSFDKNSYSDGNIWKDLTSSGNDFVWDKEPSLDVSDGFSLKDNKLVTSKYLLNNLNNFSIAFFYEGKLNNSGVIFVTNKYKLSILCEYTNCKYVFKHNNKTVTWKVGMPQSRSLYVLINNDNTNEVLLYKDGILINSITSYKNNKYNQYIKGFIVNSGKKLKGNLSSFCIFGGVVTKDYIDILNYYYNKTILYSNIVNNQTSIFNNPDTSNYQFLKNTTSTSKDVEIVMDNKVEQELSINSESPLEGEEVVKKCPFTKESLTCDTCECKNTNWSDSKSISRRCQLIINDYCKKNKDDISCKLYAKKEDIPKCSSSLSIIDKLKVNKCPKYPDMSKYIRKDKIPCWGCNL